MGAWDTEDDLNLSLGVTLNRDHLIIISIFVVFSQTLASSIKHLFVYIILKNPPLYRQ